MVHCAFVGLVSCMAWGCKEELILPAPLDSSVPTDSRSAADAGTCAAACVGDTRCLGGQCVAWGSGAYDPLCKVAPEPFAVSPRVLCHWPPSGVPMTEGPAKWQWARRVASTVVAAAFAPAPNELSLPPTWLVFATGSVLSGPTEAAPPGTWQPGGVLRVLDPQSCKLIDTLDEVPVAAWFQPPAIGDLDGDKVPEIVAQAWNEKVAGKASYQSSGRLVAWKYTSTGGTSRFRVAHQSTVAGAPEKDLVYTAGWVQMSGPTIADLDDDGKPEVVLAGRVYDSQLRRITGQAPPTAPLMLSRKTSGPFLIQLDVVADLDGDGKAELVYGNEIFSWTGKGWQRASFFKPPKPLGVGHAVLADMGVFSESPGAGKPEVIVVGYDGLRIQSIDGRIIRQFTVPTAERGGSAPSVANLDQDPTPEIMVGVDQGLFVYDLQCDTASPGPECGRDAASATGLPALPRGVRWADRPPKEAWDFMGPTTFDFDRDGKLEVIYADECFLRVYDGPTGKVLYSHWRPSRTASEVPVVVGTNSGADTVLAIGLHSSYFCSQATGKDGVPLYDPQFPGVSCLADVDCPGPSGTCLGGRCRCKSSADCCAPGQDCKSLGYDCHPPPAGDTQGNTCRAVRVPDSSTYSLTGALEEGIDVLTDSLGRWAPARGMWNQDAYTVTNVGDDGSIPRTSEVVPNWSKLNSFRSNQAGQISAAAVPDLTARRVAFACSGGVVSGLAAELCNRGTRAATAYQVLRFSGNGTKLCDATTTKVLLAGACTKLKCAPATPVQAGTHVVARANPDGRTRECGDRSNNTSKPETARCP